MQIAISLALTLWRAVTAPSSPSFLLREDSNYILREDGSKFVRE